MLGFNIFPSLWDKLKKLIFKIINSLCNNNNNIFSVIYDFISRAAIAFLNFFKNWEQNYYKIFLFLFIVTGFFIRFPYTKAGLPYINNGDEIHIAGRAMKMLQTGDFNPHYFNYPSLTTYLVLPSYVLNYFRLKANGLSSLHNISIGWDAAYDGIISHPSFYAVGRLVITLLGLISIFLIYEVGKRYFNRKVGLISALILTLFPLHIHWSTILNPNMTVTFFVLLSLFFLSLYIEKSHVKYIILAGLSTGLTIASKYNSFLIIATLILGILFYSKKKFRDIWIIFTTNAFGFLLGCPYAVFDFNRFLDDSGHEVYHYRFRGHPGFEGTPGIEQLNFYLSHFKNWINQIFHIKKVWNLSLIGLLIYLIRDVKKFLIIFSFPVLYILYMIQQKVNFLRNMVCVTPFIALSIAIAVYYIYKMLLASFNFFRKKRLFRFSVHKDFIFIGCLLILLIPLRPVGVIKNANACKESRLKACKESRTKAVEYVRDNIPNAKIGISMELMIHASDLDKIQNKVLFNTEMESLFNLHEKNFDYIISSNFYSYYDEQKGIKYSNRIKVLNEKFPKQDIIKSFGTDTVNLDYLSVNPIVSIYKVDKAFLNEK